MVGHRFLPTTDCEKKEMLASCGVSSIEDLLQGIPKAVRFVGDLNQDEALSEMEIKRKIFHFFLEMSLALMDDFDYMNESSSPSSPSS